MFEITQGKVKLNSLWWTETDNIIVAEGDLRAKYAEIQAADATTAYLYAGKHTLHTETSDDFTSIQLLKEGWSFFQGEVSRYTFRGTWIKDGVLDNHTGHWDHEAKST